MKELEVTWGRAAVVYWALLWRTLIWLAFVFVVSIVIGVLMYLRHIPVEAHLLKIQLIVGLIGLPVGVFIIKETLSAPSKSFRIVLMSMDDTSSSKAQDKADKTITTKPES